MCFAPTTALLIDIFVVSARAIWYSCSYSQRLTFDYTLAKIYANRGFRCRFFMEKNRLLILVPAIFVILKNLILV